MSMPVYAIILVLVCVVVLLGVMLAVVKRCLIVVMPDELVVLVGRKYRTADGSIASYRVVTAGRVFRIPIIERVMRMSRGPYPGELDMDRVYAAGGDVLQVRGRFAAWIASDARSIGRALERFMGMDRAAIARTAAQTLAGRLRAELAEADGAALAEDPLAVQDLCMRAGEEGSDDLGLELRDCELAISRVYDAAERAERPLPAGQALAAALADPDLSQRDRAAALMAARGEPFQLDLSVARIGPPSPSELPAGYQGGLSAYGRAYDQIEVEVVFPVSRMAEVELLQGGGLEIPLLILPHRWVEPRHCLVALAAENPCETT